MYRLYSLSDRHSEDKSLLGCYALGYIMSNFHKKHITIFRVKQSKVLLRGLLDPKDITPVDWHTLSDVSKQQFLYF